MPRHSLALVALPAGLALALASCFVDSGGSSYTGESSSGSSSTGEPTGTTGSEPSECEKLAQRTAEILELYCSKCHGPDGTRQAAIDYITDLEQVIERGKVRPGDLESSRIYKRMTEERYPMPPMGQLPRLTVVDLRTVRIWILACAELLEEEEEESFTTAPVP